MRTNSSTVIALFAVLLDYSSFIGAWIPANLQQQQYRKEYSADPSSWLLPKSRGTSALSTLDRDSVNFQKVTIQSNFFINDILSTNQDNAVVHVIGLFESLKSMPLLEFVVDDYFEDAAWMNICRDDECEVSMRPKLAFTTLMYT